MIPHSRPTLGADELRAVAARLETGKIAEGDGAARLESSLARHYGFRDAVAVGSGCQALYLALKLRGIGAGHQVIVPTYVCPEVLGVIELLQAEPVLADVNDTYALSSNDPALANHHDAIILPSLFGKFTNPTSFDARAPIIEDWAQYAPSSSRFLKSNLAIVSFEATKLLTGGEGGAILVQSQEDAAALRKLKCVAGTDLKLNMYPLSDLQAALAEAQLAKLDDFLERRRAIAHRYDAALCGVNGLYIPARPSDEAPFRYVVRLHSTGKNIDSVIQKFEELGVSVRKPVSVMLHHVRPSERQFPTADRLYDTTFSLPLYPSLTQDECGKVIAATLKVFS